MVYQYGMHACRLLLYSTAIANDVYKCIGQATSIRAMFEIVSSAFRARNYLMLQSRKMISVRLNSAQNSVHVGI